MTNLNTEDGQWSEGLVSAARMVAAATHNLCESANSLVKGHASEETLIGAAKQVAGSTAQLLLACKVKADPESATMRRLEAASNQVRKATENLVKSAQQALDQEEEAQNVDLNKSAVNIVIEEINARSEVERMERELNSARKKLETVHQRRYQTDSETEQSGYESSGYDDTSFRKYTNTSPYRPTFYSSQSPNMSGQESETQQTLQQHEIVSGPSFNESLERFRSATGSGTESDGGGPGGNYKQSTFKQQKYHSTSSSTGANSSIQKTAVTKQVEEQRTMISRSSQKFVSH
jgi:talin